MLISLMDIPEASFPLLGRVVLLLAILLPPPALGCGHPTAGSCLEDTGTATCMSEDCCNAVCSDDPFCCNQQWDDICAGEALEICSVAIDSIDPAVGPEAGGTTITIVGELLSGPSISTDVTVGGTPCTNVVVNNDNQVTCETPAGSGFADVTAVNNEPGLLNSTGTLADAFSYLSELIFEDRFESSSP